MLINRLFKQILSALFTYVIITTVVMADEITEVVNDVAAKLVQQLPMDKKIALKSLSPEETGLPEDFLRKLTSDLEAALLTASDFEINLANRLSLEDVWQEAVEFNNADFDELFKSANADVMLMMAPRAISTGVEIAITAYSLTGDNVGKTLASSGSVLLPIDLQANLGVDVNDLNKKMAQVLAEIEKVGQTGGLISNPNTYAEFYHNARLLQQRGEIDLALSNYENAIFEGFLFLDPVEDLVDLLVARYGENAEKYLEKRLQPKMAVELFQYAKWLLNPSVNSLSYENFANNNALFPPLVALWLDQNLVTLVETLRGSDAEGMTDYETLFAFLEGARMVVREFDSGSLQDYYIDKFRAKKIVSLNELRNLIEEFNRLEFSVFETDYQYGTGFKYIDISACDVSKCGSGGFPAFGVQATSTYQTPSYGSGSFMGEALSSYIKEQRIDYGKIDWSSIFQSTAMNEDMWEKYKQFEDQVYYPPENGILGPCGFILDELQNKNQKTEALTSLKLLDGANRGLFYPQDNTEKDAIIYKTSVFGGIYDRMWLADLCLDLFNSDTVKSQKYGFELSQYARQPASPEFIDKSRIAKMHGVRSILITDNVDVSKPVKIMFGFVTYGGGGIWGNYLGSVDITKDGSYISNFGMPFESEVVNFPETNSQFKLLDNNWLYIPGIVQGSVGMETPNVFSVEYTDMSGRKVTTENIFFALPPTDSGPFVSFSHGIYAPFATGDSFPSYFCNRYPTECFSMYEEELSHFFDEDHEKNLNNGILKQRYCKQLKCVGGVGIEKLASYSYFRAHVMHNRNAYVLASKAPLTCYISESTANIANVQNFTNLRQQAGLNGRVIGKVGLGEQVRIVDPGRYLRYDRCAAACEGSNQNAIKQCINNNDVWIEVQYNGRRGFLSRKFLE